MANHFLITVDWELTSKEFSMVKRWQTNYQVDYKDLIRWLIKSRQSIKIMQPKLSKNAKNIPILPWEIIDEILMNVGDGELAVELGRFLIVKKIEKTFDFSWAIKTGKLGYLKYLNENGQVAVEGIDSALRLAARNNHLNVIRYYHENIVNVAGYYLIDYAFAAGRLELMKFLISIGSKASTSVADSACTYGSLETVVWILENTTEGCTTYAMESAAENGRLEVFKLLHFNRRPSFGLCKTQCEHTSQGFSSDFGELKLISFH